MASGRKPGVCFLISVGLSNRKACQFVSITQRGRDVPLKGKGDDRLKESVPCIYPSYQRGYHVS